MKVLGSKYGRGQGPARLKDIELATEKIENYAEGQAGYDADEYPGCCVSEGRSRFRSRQSGINGISFSESNSNAGAGS